jgi:hypothetical protein
MDLPDVEDWADGFYYNLQTGSTVQYANQGFSISPFCGFKGMELHPSC